MRVKECGAKTRAGTPCKRASMLNGRCNLHGGKSLCSFGHPNYKHGYYSKYSMTRGLVQAAIRLEQNRDRAEMIIAEERARKMEVEAKKKSRAAKKAPAWDHEMLVEVFRLMAKAEAEPEDPVQAT